MTATPFPFAKTLISSLGVAVMREPLASEKKKKNTSPFVGSFGEREKT